MRPARNWVPLATALAATALLLRPIHAEGKRKGGEIGDTRISSFSSIVYPKSRKNDLAASSEF